MSHTHICVSDYEVHIVHTYHLIIVSVCKEGGSKKKTNNETLLGNKFWVANILRINQPEKIRSVLRLSAGYVFFYYFTKTKLLKNVQ